MMAEDYLRMGISKVNGMQLPEPFEPEEEYSKDILVVGGGLTGLNAAIHPKRSPFSGKPRLFRRRRCDSNNGLG